MFKISYYLIIVTIFCEICNFRLVKQVFLEDHWLAELPWNNGLIYLHLNM